MSAYAEDAYGKPGYFQVFFLYFLSLAIGNVAIAISAVGYLAAFFPWLSSTPIATCIGVIALLWLTTVANFGGPSDHRPHRLDDGLGRHPPGRTALGRSAGSGSARRRSRRPGIRRVSASAQGMGSSIALTLWAFLGMESAAQNSDAVENPKRNVPLACMFGTLGAAVIYVLSTTVIQGIVPNAELAKSTGPFGLAYAQMFNPTVGSIIMALAVLACLGSLLGWQFTHRADRRSRRRTSSMFPAVLREGEPHRRADRRHDHHGRRPVAAGAVDDLAVAQRAVRRPREPRRRHQRRSVHHRAVGAARDDAGGRRRRQAEYRRTLPIAVVAMLYSVYAIYASGKDAVLGGMRRVGHRLRHLGLHRAAVRTLVSAHAPTYRNAA